MGNLFTQRPFSLGVLGTLAGQLGSDLVGGNIYPERFEGAHYVTHSQLCANHSVTCFPWTVVLYESSQ